MISEQDKAALIALLVRFHRCEIERDKAKAEIDSATIRQKKALTDIEKLKTAFSVFKFDTAPAGAWHELADIIGDLEFSRAIAVGKGVPHPSINPVYRPGGTKDGIDEVDEDKVNDSEKPDSKFAPKIRQLVIDQLKIAGSVGIKAPQIKYILKSEFDVEMNEKTVGMTLWRLAKDDLAHRVGRLWFAGPAPQEKPEDPEPDNKPESVDPAS